MKAVELFAGAGGLGMGLSLAGFEPVGVVVFPRKISRKPPELLPFTTLSCRSRMDITHL